MDIVERLDALTFEEFDEWPTASEKLCKEAAAEIVALRKRVEALEGALTPSAETKAAYMGEFSFTFPAHDRDGSEVMFTPNVPWTTIKEIMAAISARAALRAKGGGNGDA